MACFWAVHKRRRVRVTYGKAVFWYRAPAWARGALVRRFQGWRCGSVACPRPCLRCLPGWSCGGTELKQGSYWPAPPLVSPLVRSHPFVSWGVRLMDGEWVGGGYWGGAGRMGAGLFAEGGG